MKAPVLSSMDVLVERRRIDPADMAIRAAVDEIDPAMSGMTEHDDAPPFMSSCVTASLTVMCFDAVVNSAMITGCHSVASSSPS